MTAKVFLDANILLYACSNAPDDRQKQHLAQQLILSAPFALSAQVLQEFIANALRKKALGISEANIDATLEMATQVRVLPITQELIMSAVILRRRLHVSHWDSTILAAALELRCHTLYSEDLNHGQDYGGVRVINPFRSEG
jgi:predicted nucleic acid-binding protein